MTLVYTLQASSDKSGVPSKSCSAVEFLNNKSQNPLAFGHNETTRSDFRVFNSDGGDTMRRLASSQDFFLESCAALFQRMIDTVPRVVKLSEPITPIPLKPDNINIAIDTGGTMTITGNIRVHIPQSIKYRQPFASKAAADHGLDPYRQQPTGRRPQSRRAPETKNTRRSSRISHNSHQAGV